MIDQGPEHAIQNRPKPARRAAPAAHAVDMTSTIVTAITTAVVEHQLAPGAKLTEQTLAEIYGVSRTVVRQALFQLARDHLVTLEPGRGAFIASPSVDEAKQVFAVRRVLEQQLVEAFAERATAADLRAMREHLQKEQSIVAKVDVRGRTRLLGDFHVLMAQRVGMLVLADILSELISRCALIALMYQSSRAAQHSSDEHVAILDALQAGDVKRAGQLMEAHLRATEDSMLFAPRVAPSDLHVALAASRPRRARA